MRTMVLRVSGMTCEGCAQTVARHLKEDPGVIAVEVDWRAGRVLVAYDPALTGPERVLANPVFGLSYRASVESDQGSCC